MTSKVKQPIFLFFLIAAGIVGFLGLMMFCQPCRIFFFSDVLFYFSTAAVIIIPVLYLSNLDLVGPVFTWRVWVVFLVVFGIFYTNTLSPNVLGMLQDLFVGLPVKEQLVSVFFGMSTFAGIALLFFYAYPLLLNINIPKIKVENSTKKKFGLDFSKDHTKGKTKDTATAKAKTSASAKTAKTNKIETLIIESKLTISNYAIWMLIYLFYMNSMTSVVNRLFSRHL